MATSSAEKQLQALTEQARVWASERFPDAKEIMVSWGGLRCILDVRRSAEEADAAGDINPWTRVEWVPKDDFALAGIRGLA